MGITKLTSFIFLATTIFPVLAMNESLNSSTLTKFEELAVKHSRTTKKFDLIDIIDMYYSLPDLEQEKARKILKKNFITIDIIENSCEDNSDESNFSSDDSYFELNCSDEENILDNDTNVFDQYWLEDYDQLYDEKISGDINDTNDQIIGSSQDAAIMLEYLLGQTQSLKKIAEDILANHAKQLKIEVELAELQKIAKDQLKQELKEEIQDLKGQIKKFHKASPRQEKKDNERALLSKARAEVLYATLNEKLQLDITQLEQKKERLKQILKQAKYNK